MKKLQFTVFAIILIVLASCKTQQATVKKVEETKIPLTQTLKSGKWVLYNENGKMKGSGGQDIFIQFTEDSSGSISGNSGCNGFSGSANFSDNGSLKIGQLIATKRYCTDFPEESKVMSLFAKANKYNINEKELKLYNGDLELMRFKLEN